MKTIWGIIIVIAALHIQSCEAESDARPKLTFYGGSDLMVFEGVQFTGEGYSMVHGITKTEQIKLCATLLVYNVPFVSDTLGRIHINRGNFVDTNFYANLTQKSKDPGWLEMNLPGLFK